jgi:hypothetical protein
MQFVFWTLEPAKHVFLAVVCFVKGGLGRFVGMPKFRVKESLRKITGALEALVEAVKTHQCRNAVTASGERLIHESHD